MDIGYFAQQWESDQHSQVRLKYCKVYTVKEISKKNGILIWVCTRVFSILSSKIIYLALAQTLRSCILEEWWNTFSQTGQLRFWQEFSDTDHKWCEAETCPETGRILCARMCSDHVRDMCWEKQQKHLDEKPAGGFFRPVHMTKPADPGFTVNITSPVHFPPKE